MLIDIINKEELIKLLSSSSKEEASIIIEEVKNIGGNSPMIRYYKFKAWFAKNRARIEKALR